MVGAKYNLIYEYYKCHILFGKLRQGDFLPAIEQIGDTFQVAPQTVRNALKNLQKEGLVSVSPGRNTIVTYAAAPEDMSSYTKEFYFSRKDGMKQIYLIAELLLMPIYQKGCQQLTDHDLFQIMNTAKQKSASVASISMFCCSIMMRKVDNWLAKSLFLDMLSFFQFPYITTFDKDNNEEYRQYYQMLLTSCEVLNRDGVFQAFTGFQNLARKTLQTYVDKGETEVLVPEQISFHWKTYRERPQHYQTLAAHIIKQIMDGKYTERIMLPSYVNMADQFGVSVNTIRRTMELLRNLGVIRSLNGIGSQVLFTAPDWKKLRRSSIQNNVALAGESIEMIQLTAEDIIQKSFSHLDDQRVRDMKDMLQSKKGGCALELVIHAAEYINVIYPSVVVNEIFYKLFESLFLLYPLLLNQVPTADAGVSHLADRMDRALAHRDAKQFSQGFMDLLNYVQADIEQMMLALQTQ